MDNEQDECHALILAMLKRFQVTLVLAAACVCWPIAARAQIDNRLAVGLSVTSRVVSSSGTGGSADVGFEVRLGHEREEWGWAYSFFNWFDMDLQAPPTLPTGALGRLRDRPIMVGYGYTWIRGRAAITADMLGGYAFNSFHLDPGSIAEYQRRGATTIDSEATNTFVVKPEIQLWYDLSPRIGIKVSGGYLVSRPSVTITSSLGRETRLVRADAVLITVGVVYSVR